jgi:hypothetical protein
MLDSSNFQNFNIINQENSNTEEIKKEESNKESSNKQDCNFCIAILKHFKNSSKFSFVDVFNFLSEFENRKNLNVYSINKALSDLTHLGTFKRFSDEIGLQYYSSLTVM